MEQDIQQIRDIKTVAAEQSVRRELPPNGILTLVMGILSCQFAIFGIGFIFSIIGLTQSKVGLAALEADPSRYTAEATLRVGRILSKVGIWCSMAGFLFWVVYIGLIVVLVLASS